MKIITLILVFIFHSQIEYTRPESKLDGIEDGEYYAQVSYFNKNTYSKSTYELIVDVKNGSVVKIEFSDGYLTSEYYYNKSYVWSGGYLRYNSYQNSYSTDINISEGGSLKIYSVVIQ